MGKLPLQLAAKAGFNRLREQQIRRIFHPVLLKCELETLDQIKLLGEISTLSELRNNVEKLFKPEFTLDSCPSVAVAVNVRLTAGIVGNGYKVELSAVENRNKLVADFEIRKNVGGLFHSRDKDFAGNRVDNHV